jgi:nicotinamide-nucleotide amidase
MQPTLDTIHQCLDTLVFGYEDDEMQHAVLRLLANRKQTMAVVEWGTTGLVDHWLGECRECATAFRGGLVLRDVAGIEILSSLAAELAGVMGLASTAALSVVAQAARERFAADFALVIGPLPEVGENLLVAIAGAPGVVVREIPFTGHPDILLPRAAKQALNLLRLAILADPAAKG